MAVMGLMHGMIDDNMLMTMLDGTSIQMKVLQCTSRVLWENNCSYQIKFWFVLPILLEWVESFAYCKSVFDVVMLLP